METRHRTRRFVLLPKYKSRTAHSVKYPHSYSMDSNYTISDAHGKPTIHALAPTQKTTDTSLWSMDFHDKDKRPRLQKPTFVDGTIKCSNTGFGIIEGEFLANSPKCQNGANAHPEDRKNDRDYIAPVYYEIKLQETAEQKRKYKRLKSNVENLIFNMQEDELSGYCVVYGINTKDRDGYKMSIELMQDNLTGLLESNANGETDTYEDFLRSLDDDNSQVGLHVAMGVDKGEVVFDRRSGALRFKGGSKVYQVSDKENFIDEITGWIISKPEGDAFYGLLVDRIGISLDEVTETINNNYNPTVEENGLSEMTPEELVNMGKDCDIIEYTNGKGFYFLGEDVVNELGLRVKSKNAMYSYIANSEEFRASLESEIAKRI